MTTEAGPVDPGAGRLPRPLLVLGFVLFAVAGVLAGLLEVTLIPLRHGTTLVPVAPVLAVLTGVLLPTISRGLTDSTAAAVPPAIGQLVAVWLLATGRPEGDVLMPAGSTAWVSYAVLVLGTLVPLGMLGLVSRTARWRWLGGQPSIGQPPISQPSISRSRPRHGSGSGGGR